MEPNITHQSNSTTTEPGYWPSRHRTNNSVKWTTPRSNVKFPMTAEVAARRINERRTIQAHRAERWLGIRRIGKWRCLYGPPKRPSGTECGTRVQSRQRVIRPPRPHNGPSGYVIFMAFGLQSAQETAQDGPLRGTPSQPTTGGGNGQ